MTDQRKDGGPVFPVETTATPYAPGMSLRDWFAGQAGASILGCLVSAGQSLSPEDAAKVAVAAYFHADAMIAAREVTE